MSNCQVSHSEYSGVFVHAGLITINGSGTSIHNDVTGYWNGHYGLSIMLSSRSDGLFTYKFSSIHLVSPLTKESISIDNGRSEGNFNCFNYNSAGTIKTIEKK